MTKKTRGEWLRKADDWVERMIFEHTFAYFAVLFVLCALVLWIKWTVVR